MESEVRLDIEKEIRKCQHIISILDRVYEKLTKAYLELATLPVEITLRTYGYRDIQTELSEINYRLEDKILREMQELVKRIASCKVSYEERIALLKARMEK